MVMGSRGDLVLKGRSDATKKRVKTNTNHLMNKRSKRADEEHVLGRAYDAIYEEEQRVIKPLSKKDPRNGLRFRRDSITAIAVHLGVEDIRYKEDKYHTTGPKKGQIKRKAGSLQASKDKVLLALMRRYGFPDVSDDTYYAW